MKKGVNKFLKPKSIAIIGASETPRKVGYILMKKLIKFKGKIFPVNINKEIILGKKAYKSVKEIKSNIDLAIIATHSEKVEKIIIECSAKKIKNIIIISAGFAEAGNISLQNKIMNLSKKFKMNILGPNCFGVENPYINLDTTFSKESPKKGDIAFISQSGALWSFLSDLNYKGFSGFVSLGNMMDLDFVDFIEYFNKDKRTKRIILYMEKIKRGREFIEVCKKSSKEITVVKTGKSKEGLKAAISHTASLATDYEIYKGAFKQAKIKVVNSLYEALKTNSNKKEIIQFPKPNKDENKNKTIVLTNAGGAGALISDLCEEKGFKLIGSPKDILGTASPDDYKTALNKIRKNKNCNTIMVVLTPQSMSEPKIVAEEIVRFSKNHESKSKRIIAFFLGEKSLKESWRILEDNGIECYKRI
jgi:acetyltransferase